MQTRKAMAVCKPKDTSIGGRLARLRPKGHLDKNRYYTSKNPRKHLVHVLFQVVAAAVRHVQHAHLWQIKINLIWRRQKVVSRRNFRCLWSRKCSQRLDLGLSVGRISIVENIICCPTRHALNHCDPVNHSLTTCSRHRFKGLRYNCAS